MDEDDDVVGTVLPQPVDKSSGGPAAALARTAWLPRMHPRCGGWRRW